MKSCHYCLLSITSGDVLNKIRIIFDDAVDWVLRGEIANTLLHSGSECKALLTKQKKLLINITDLSMASWQNCQNIAACEMQFQCFYSVLWFQSFLFSESKISIPVRCHRYLKCRLHVANASTCSISTVRAIHNSNSVA